MGLSGDRQAAKGTITRWGQKMLDHLAHQIDANKEPTRSFELPSGPSCGLGPRSKQQACRKRIACQRGAACVEFAFVAPFLFFLIFGSIEFSRMIMIKQSLTNAAREGCRQASLVNTISMDPVEQTVRSCLKGSIAGYTDQTEVRVQFEPQNVAGLAPGTPITTTIEVNCADISWLPAILFADSTLSTSATMNRE